eukprot:25491_1
MDPTSDCNTLNYDLYSIINFNDFTAWEDLDTGVNSGEFWCTADWPTPDCTVDVDICKYELGQNECSTGSPIPTHIPTPNPSSPLTTNPSKSAGVRTFDAKYVKLTIPTYPQYEGFYYNTNDSETTCASSA